MTSRTALASALALALLLNTGCAGTDEANVPPPHPADVLVGCYAQENGDEPDLQVSGADGSYRLGKAGSSRPHEEALILSALKQHEWMQLPTDVAGQLEALIRDDMGVILLMKFRPDAVIDGKAPPSPFHFVAPRIGGALTRVPCPAS